jgi:N utilization substance protein B
MPGRHRSRQHALQVLFLWDQRRQAIEDAISAFYDTLSSEEEEPSRAEPDEFMETLVRGASENASDIDRRITEKSENWRLERMPAVDRNLLRMAVGEMLGFKGTPFPIVINEALEIGRRYSAPESINFLNGMLDSIARSLLPK